MRRDVTPAGYWPTIRSAWTSSGSWDTDRSEIRSHASGAAARQSDSPRVRTTQGPACGPVAARAGRAQDRPGDGPAHDGPTDAGVFRRRHSPHESVAARAGRDHGRSDRRAGLRGVGAGDTGPLRGPVRGLRHLGQSRSTTGGRARVCGMRSAICGIEDLGGRCVVRGVRGVPVRLAGNEHPWFPVRPRRVAVRCAATVLDSAVPFARPTPVGARRTAST